MEKETLLKLDKYEKKLKNLIASFKVIESQITELKRQIDLEKTNTMNLVYVDGKLCWRAGKIDELVFISTAKTIQASSKDNKDKNDYYRILFSTLANMSKNNKNLLNGFLKELKINTVNFKKEELSDLSNDIQNLKKEISNLQEQTENF
ncbi:hypothetical protein [Lactococcus lactis]|jgi:hypothetical protein|uniref:Uncharacterized protein n=1 Tax=Lactococcus lactis TaxID=1358 RepID=A0A943VU47_9LACT|nr:hypothetical protein [Lactococcus lactis]KSU15912.1 hypothetical protein LMG9446_0587 [Lactococcus lactis subsp. lactis]MBS7067926.1 hypothetical protein [Lactococcus lactis]MCG0999990.1 hypothetical protein [Lactococcus lactis]MCH5431014.1 hypothetical protein [Lactococcus lactis]MCT0044594.1 hypothetical protein [Lactococcus lactis subsp. lactis]